MCVYFPVRCHIIKRYIQLIILLYTIYINTGIPQPMGALLALCIDLLTELVPATSLAYERPESLIMKVPPRNIKTDKLTSFTLLFYAYGQAGMILTAGCLFVYFQTFAIYGVTAPAIFQIKNLYFPVATSGTDDAITYYPSNDGRSVFFVLKCNLMSFYILNLFCIFFLAVWSI